ncbi:MULTISPECIES: ribonuclease HII [unclassified Polaribacter]|jgi:ribonuclease HII|uniref:ribonuclease HII n=1 Tax=unclassified Polaribacter TaxID=196858 RepID=UPI00052E3A03|nr:MULTISPECIES: ribonuclease HII [unclassified Polaribacter]KGL59531.1 ribonuclease HII [Polaribacter sp. Hel1_33_49]MDG1194995.1 ribonuclease HII [Polaribacter sp.]MDG1402746.1 ribonuclease HII [Polaribacter sp.]MDG2436609.1 ribonuclease HII [Polaribacter sp.]PKV64025.1 RNase HII [Polaribacter sp. Hel1_33_96]
MLKSNFSGFSLEAGTDEAGRGCLCGPVVAAAVILRKDFTHPFLNDSKQLSEKKREELRPFIEENAIAFGVSFVWQDEVDEINVLQASITGMHRAITELEILPEFIIVDGNKFKNYKEIPHETIVKGDAKYVSIAAASVLAKTYRDEYMEKIHQEFPMYNWQKNKGYPTKEHRNGIRKFGITQYHRKTFRLLPEQIKLDL